MGESKKLHNQKRVFQEAVKTYAAGKKCTVWFEDDFQDMSAMESLELGEVSPDGTHIQVTVTTRIVDKMFKMRTEKWSEQVAIEALKLFGIGREYEFNIRDYGGLENIPEKYMPVELFIT
jgi:hypothetical protein